MLHITNQLKGNLLSSLKITTVVFFFLSIASHTGCTKIILQICNNWLVGLSSLFCSPSTLKFTFFKEKIIQPVISWYFVLRLRPWSFFKQLFFVSWIFYSVWASTCQERVMIFERVLMWLMWRFPDYSFSKIYGGGWIFSLL